jgi:hypothetical protein
MDGAACNSPARFQACRSMQPLPVSSLGMRAARADRDAM